MGLFSNNNPPDSSLRNPKLVAMTRLPQPVSFSNWLQQSNPQDLIGFSRNVATMVESGVPLTKIMNRQKAHASHPRLRQAVADIEKALAAGSSFTEALEQHPACFDTLYINVVRAGEQSGRLDYALYRLADLLERTYGVQAKIKPLVIYPLFVIGVVVVDLLIFLGVILPMLFSQVKSVLGEVTGLLGGVAWLLQFWWAPLVFSVVILVCGIQFLKTEYGRQLWHEAILYAPFASTTVQYIQAYYFVLGVLMGYSGGLTLSRAAGLGVSAMTNLSVRDVFSGVEDEIEAGKTLTETLLERGYLPETVMDMIATGEDCGELEKMLDNALKHLEVEINTQIENLMAWMKPLLILTAALILGGGLLVVYLGVFSFVGGVVQQAMSQIPTFKAP